MSVAAAPSVGQKLIDAINAGNAEEAFNIVISPDYTNIPSEELAKAATLAKTKMFSYHIWATNRARLPSVEGLSKHAVTSFVTGAPK